jgi:hypothetical protein
MEANLGKLKTYKQNIIGRDETLQGCIKLNHIKNEDIGKELKI